MASINFTRSVLVADDVQEDRYHDFVQFAFLNTGVLIDESLISGVPNHSEMTLRRRDAVSSSRTRPPSRTLGGLGKMHNGIDQYTMTSNSVSVIK
jgi:hypothetical protein